MKKTNLSKLAALPVLGMVILIAALAFAGCDNLIGSGLQAPAAPSAPTVIPADSQLTVSWTAVAGATSYEVYYNTANNSASAQKLADDVSAPPATITGLTNGTLYYVWLKAKNSAGTSGFSPGVSGTPVAPITPPTDSGAPAAPAAPTVTPADSQLTVSWPAVSGATSYEVYHNTTNTTTGASQLTSDIAAPATSASITGLTNGTPYYVWVKAKNSAGTSGFSPAASGTPQAAATAPNAPSAPTVTPGNTELGVSWTAVESATAYEVWYGTSSSSGSAAQFGGDVSSGTSTAITGLSNGTLYYVWVKAKNSAGTSGFSPSASGTPALPPPAAPGKPALIHIKSNNTQTDMTGQGGEIKVSWNAVSGATQYEVYYAPCVTSAPAIPASPAVTVSATTATITASGIGDNTMNYYVWVKAKNADGVSAASPAMSTLDRFIGHWTDPAGYDGGIPITNADVLYEIFPGYGVYGYIRAIVPFSDAADFNFQNRIGAAGVIIVEYDESYMSGSGWMYRDGCFFNAVYYYGLTGEHAGSLAYLGFAALLEDTSAGCEEETLNDALTAFTFANKDLYIEPTVAAVYQWFELTP